MPTLLAVIPHPDDESYGFAGAIGLAARAGWRCVVHCATSGERGKRHDGGPAGALNVGRAREAELGESCRLLGAEPPVFWGLPDGALRLHDGERRRLRAALDSLQPDVVLTLGPDGAYGHPDHLAVHRWVVDGWAEGGGRSTLLFAAFPEGLFVPQWEKCRHMLGEPPSPAAGEMGTASADYVLDITAVAALKLSVIAAHRTQLPGGDPHALFPAGIVAALLAEERFTLAGARPAEPPLPGMREGRLL